MLWKHPCGTHRLAPPLSVPVRTLKVDTARRLALEWQAFVVRAHALRKVFVSVKGFYYQAEIMGQQVTWLVPHQLAQVGALLDELRAWWQDAAGALMAHRLGLPVALHTVEMLTAVPAVLQDDGAPASPSPVLMLVLLPRCRCCPLTWTTRCCSPSWSSTSPCCSSSTSSCTTPSG